MFHLPTLSSFLLPPVQFSSVAQLCPTLCDPMSRSTPGLPVHHQLPEFTQTHLHRVSDAIQPSDPLSSPSPPVPIPPSIKVFSSESTLCMRWPKYWSFSFSISPRVHLRNTGLEEAQVGIKIAGGNINNLRYADDTTLMAESKEELKSLLMKVKRRVKKLA